MKGGSESEQGGSWADEGREKNENTRVGADKSKHELSKKALRKEVCPGAAEDARCLRS